MNKSEEAIEEILLGKKVRHFGAPWFVATDNASKTASRAGFVPGFWVKVDGDFYRFTPIVKY